MAGFSTAMVNAHSLWRYVILIMAGRYHRWTDVYKVDAPGSMEETGKPVGGIVGNRG